MLVLFFSFLLKENVHFISSFDQFSMGWAMVVWGRKGRYGGRRRVITLFETESHWACTEIGLEFSGNINMGRFAGSVLDDKKEFGDNFDDMTSLQDKVALPFDPLGRKTSRYNIGLAAQLARGAWLKCFKNSI